ncbi:MAG: DMT family transporter, partial [Methylococcales bacterium]|nr:DMT family transporter [Methylococcales bacterium]
MKQRPYLAMLLGSLIIGSSPIFIRGTDAPGPISSLYRMLIGAGVMTVPFLLNLWKQRQVSATVAQIQPERNARRGIFFAVLSGVFIGIDMSFWSTGIVISGPTIPTLMANTAPLWVGLGTWLFFRERRGVGFWVGLVVALLGVSLILGQDLSAAGNVRLGAIFGIVSAFFYGLYYL